MAAILWFVGAVLLAVGELLVGEFFLLMLAAAALSTAGFSWIFDFPIWVDAVFFFVMSIALLAGVRPLLLKRLHAKPAIEGTVKELEGRTAVVTQEITSEHGQIRLLGELWTARPLDITEKYPEGTSVTVAHIDGSTAIVWRQL
ncbi:NfeD family protein [Hoyosella sp. YIM 151337]|uniref:NfeD family protein n=1 Tax=Hoyosella sp. YIM 151337 TaxID=2992742 RepID=UPI002235CEBB|nr:NfeD family protein [Hoyosella sp. YIM 151337]MCW4353143.1 NfeD family protein [Hoyosella sp. YIM 151337]